MDTSNWYEQLDIDSKNTFQTLLKTTGVAKVTFKPFIIGKPTLDFTLPHTFAVEMPSSNPLMSTVLSTSFIENDQTR